MEITQKYMIKPPNNPKLIFCSKCRVRINDDGRVKWWILFKHKLWCKGCFRKIIN